MCLLLILSNKLDLNQETRNTILQIIFVFGAPESGNEHGSAQGRALSPPLPFCVAAGVDRRQPADVGPR